MPNTFPANLPYPNSFDPVANGAQNIEDLAEAVNDGGGLWKIATFTASGTSRALVCDNIFTSGYENYKIHVKLVSPASNNTLFFQFLDLVGAQITGGYGATSYGRDYFTGTTGVTPIGGGGVVAPIGRMPATIGSPLPHLSAEMTVTTPRTTDNWKSAFGQYVGIDSGVQFQAGEFYCMNNAAPLSRGIRFDNTAAANLTGKVTIYGYRN
jgi:hypothetical protein